MRRRSERGKKEAPTKEESPEKPSKISQRQSRRRRKSSSPDGEKESAVENVESVSEPLQIQVHDIELPQGENPVAASNNKDMTKNSEQKNEWKEDTSFWESDSTKASQENPTDDTEKDKESSLWKVQSSNGASGGGEIQKLKICRQRPTESPESGDSSPRKSLRVSRGAKDTDESTPEESEKESKKSRHRTRTSSKNSPLVSPAVVCDISEGSPTKIKIINVGHLNAENKLASSGKSTNDKSGVDDSQSVLQNHDKEDTLDIALPTENPPTNSGKPTTEKIVTEESTENCLQTACNDPSEVKDSKESEKQNEAKEENKSSLSKPDSPLPSTRKQESKSQSSGSDGDSNSSEDNSTPRKTKKKRRRELQSSVQRRLSTTTASKNDSSDSEDESKKKNEGEPNFKESTDSKQDGFIKETGVSNDISHTTHTENNLEENKEIKEEQPRPMPRKRRWGSSKTSRIRKPSITISTDSLKSLLPDVKPVPAEELQLSVEEDEEGQVHDEEEEEGVEGGELQQQFYEAVEDNQQEQQEKEERHKEKEREREAEDKKRRKDKHERSEKRKPDHPLPSPESADNTAASRKILLLPDDARKLARSPSPPRRKPTNVLFITHLVRPFTVQQLKNLLLRTGTIAENGFWIDKIKSKCYVEYTTEDAAVETRHALHGVRWPTSNPKTLFVEFATHDDLVVAQALTEEPEVPRKAEPLTMVEGWVADQARMKERSRKAIVREWDVGKPEHPDEALLEYELKMKEKEKKELERKYKKERHHRSPTPEAEAPARKSRRKDEDAPAKLLDDLFRKTKTSPCIYWLPLSPEQIAVKEEMRRQHMAEHERRMAELKKLEQSRRERERRNRK